MNSTIHDFIERSHYCQATLLQLGTMLPPEDAALDALIGDLVQASDQHQFVFVVMAALCAGRPVQARHLARGTVLLPERLTLGIIASHMQGDITAPLIEAASRGNLGAELASTALFLAAHWHQQHRGGKLPADLIGVARTVARNRQNTPYDRALLDAVASLHTPSPRTAWRVRYAYIVSGGSKPSWPRPRAGVLHKPGR